MKTKEVLRRLLSVLFVGFSVWFLGPILIELFGEPPEGDEIGLLMLLVVLLLGSFVSLGLFLNYEKLNDSTVLKWVIIIEILLVGVLVFLFTYSSWILLVATLTIFYVWIKRMVKRKTTNLFNLTWISILSLFVAVYVFFQLIP